MNQTQTEAMDLVKRANDAYQANNYADALQLYREAYKLYSSESIKKWIHFLQRKVAPDKKATKAEKKQPPAKAPKSPTLLLEALGLQEEFRKMSAAYDKQQEAKTKPPQLPADASKPKAAPAAQNTQPPKAAQAAKPLVPPKLPQKAQPPEAAPARQAQSALQFPHTPTTAQSTNAIRNPQPRPAPQAAPSPAAPARSPAPQAAPQPATRPTTPPPESPHPHTIASRSALRENPKLSVSPAFLGIGVGLLLTSVLSLVLLFMLFGQVKQAQQGQWEYKIISVPVNASAQQNATVDILPYPPPPMLAQLTKDGWELLTIKHDNVASKGQTQRLLLVWKRKLRR